MSTILNEILKPGIEVEDIVIPKDPKDSENNNKKAVHKIGYNTPVIKIKDFVIEKDMIINCKLIVGESLLPEIFITISDEYYRLREDMMSEKVLIIANFGTTNDPYYIKQEFILNNITGIATSPNIYLSGYLHIPQLYELEIEYFEDLTTFEIITEICKRCNLGLLSNITNTEDTQKLWIRDNKTLIQFIDTLIKHSHVNNNTYIECFIDQYYYLNIIDVKKSFDARIPEKTEIEPSTGESLNKVWDVKLNSSKYAEENYFKIHSWSLDINYGSSTKYIPTLIKKNQLIIDTDDYELEKFDDNELWDESLQYIEYLTTHQEHLHDNYLSTVRELPIISNFLKQGDKLNVKTFTPIMLLYPYQYVPVELYIGGRTTQMELPDVKDIEEVFKEEKPQQAEPLEFKDELHSGDYIIRSITYSLNGNNGMMEQFLALQRPIQERTKDRYI